MRSVSVQSLSRVWCFATTWTAARQVSLSITSRSFTNSCPLSQWCHPTISSSVVPFSSCPCSFPATGSFISNESVLHIKWPEYWNFSFSISPSNEYSGLISFRVNWMNLLAVQGLLSVSSNTIVQKHQFFGVQLSLWSNSHIHTWLLEKP